MCIQQFSILLLCLTFSFLHTHTYVNPSSMNIIVCFCSPLALPNVLSSCVRCVEACIKYITSEAYIFTALFGKGLCESVHSTLAFLGANAARVLVLSGIGNAIVFIAKIFVVGMTGTSTYAILVYTKPYSETVSNPWLPLMISCCVAYMVTCLFMAVFARTVDTLLVCFVADERMQQKYNIPSRKPDLSKGINEHAPPPSEEIAYS